MSLMNSRHGRVSLTVDELEEIKLVVQRMAARDWVLALGFDRLIQVTKQSGYSPKPESLIEVCESVLIEARRAADDVVRSKMAQDWASERLVAALRGAGAPAKMIQQASWGYYADWLINYEQRPGDTAGVPISQFERDATAAGLTALVTRYKAGEFKG